MTLTTRRRTSVVHTSSAALAAVAAIALGCSGSSSLSPAQSCADEPARSLSAAQRAVLEQRFPPGSAAGTPYALLDRQAQIARDLPGGFAGAFAEGATVGSVGRPVVLFVNPEAGRAVLPEIASRLQQQMAPLDLSAAEIRSARWDFAQLYDWYFFLRDEMYASGGVRGSGISVVENRIGVGVSDDAARKRLEQRLAELDVPCGLVQVKITQAVISIGR